MLVHERRAALEGILKDNGTIVVSELAKQWHVSEMTVRRDLKALADQGMLARVHGGAVAQGSLRFSERRGKDTKAKHEAVAKLIEYIPQHGCIYLDGSTTILGMTQHLAKHVGLTVATNNLTIFQALQQYPSIEACLIGGTLDHEVDNFVGPIAQKAISSLVFDAAFLSAYALHPEFGLCEPSIEDAAIKELVLQRSAQAYVAISSEKFERHATGNWSGDAQKMHLATELDKNDERLRYFKSTFTEIL